jgi:hypothetical protein
VVEKCYGRETHEELKFYQTKERTISLNLRGWPVSENVQIIGFIMQDGEACKSDCKKCGFHSNFIHGTADHLSFGRDEN